MMSDVVIAAIITVVGMLLAATISQLLTFLTTRRVLSAEYQKMMAQIAEEARERRRERRVERLIEKLSELIAASDPDRHHPPLQPETATLICQCQLLLDYGSASERSLNGKLNELGIALESYVHNPELLRKETLLRVHGQMIDCAKAVVQA